MANFLLKFNHGVEIGAYNAYLGHYRRTKDPEVLRIAEEEETHRGNLAYVLAALDDAPSPAIDKMFYAIGRAVYWACQVSPIFMLNFVARTIERLAVVSYRKLREKYPRWAWLFERMQEHEEEHAKYFR